MQLRDVRRTGLTIAIIAGVALLWLFLLSLQETDRIDFGLTSGALERLTLGWWQWLVAILLSLLVALLIFLLTSVDEAPEGYARGSVRQVQCADCKAVFHLHDSGHRPLMHVCPNCKALGVYDGKAAPVGKPPEAKEPEQLIKLGLTCDRCDHGFDVTDTGQRPLQVTCPNCQSSGFLT
ncbi:MAG: hypothetical protein ACPGQL_05250 [Thermoplasmatota archaeon]